MRVICWIKELVYFLRYGTSISGHDYFEDEPYEAEDKVWYPLICERCGHTLLGWKWSYR
jgi:hypothetical protein